MDGGASSSDPFRLPVEAEELTYPFGNGLVLRYGHTPRLVASTVAVAGIAAEFPPSTQEEPYRLLYFVVMDQVRTTIAVLRAVLKDGLLAPARPPKALVIDTLQTLEVYRKQGLATSLMNFVKGIGEAHGTALYANCPSYCKSFWESRGFSEETMFEVLSVCNRVDEFNGCTVLLRAGSRYAEYEPANGHGLSSIRFFEHSSEDACPNFSGYTPDGLENGDAAAAARIIGEAPAVGALPFSGPQAESTSAVTVATLPYPSTIDGAPTAPVLTNARLARHDESEAMRLSSVAAAEIPADRAAATVTTGAASSEEESTGMALERSALAQREAAGGWPGVPPPVFKDVPDGGGVADVSMGWPPPPLPRPPAPPCLPMPHGIAAMGTFAVDAAASEEMAVRALTALPTGMASSVVDLTGGEGMQSLADQEEAQMQYAIELSLSMEPGSVGGSTAGVEVRDALKGAGAGAAGAGAADGDAPGDDTETDEEPGYGAQPSVGDAGSSGAASDMPVAVTPPNVDGIAAAAAAGVEAEAVVALGTAETSGPSLQALNGDRHRRGCAGDSGSDASSGGGGGRGRGEGSGEKEFRRIRRRRDKSGASTPGEQSPDGADGPVVADEMQHGGGALSSAERGVGDGWRPGLVDRGAGGIAGHADNRPRCNGTAPSALGPSQAMNTSGASDARPRFVCSDAEGANGAENAAGCCIGGTSTDGDRRGRSGSGTGGSAGDGGVDSGVLSARDAVVGVSGERSTISFVKESISSASSPGRGCYSGVVVAAAAAGTAAPQQSCDSQPGPASSGRDSMVVSELHQQSSQAYPAAGSPPNDRQFQPMEDSPGDEGFAPPISAAGALHPGHGGFLESHEIWRDMEPGVRDVPVGGGGGGGSLDELLAVTTWERDDADEDLRRAMEASKQSLEEEMLQRAKRESQAAAAVAAEATESATATVESGVPQYSAAFPLPAISERGGGGPNSAVLPPLVAPRGGLSGYSGRALSSAPPHGDTGHTAMASFARSDGTGSSGGGGNVWQQAAGGQAVGAAGAGGGSVVDSATWEDPGEVVVFIGKGKGRCRDR